MNISFQDKAHLRDVSTHKDGYKIIRASVARSGMQTYARHELGDAAPVGDPNDMLTIYRPASEVFADKALNGWAHVPVTLNHPDVLVTPDNYKDYAVGEVTAKARINHDTGWLDLELMVKDGPSIVASDSTHPEFSGGYTAIIDMTPGVTPDGQKYDGVQRGIDPNHLALVTNGRAFSDGVKTRDWAKAPKPQKEVIQMDMKTVVVGDKAVQVAASDADVITAIMADHKVVVDGLNDKVGELKAENAETAKKVLSEDEIEAKVADRMAVVEKASKLVDGYDAKGKSVAQIKREVVAGVYSADAASAEVSDAEINGIFRVAEPAKVSDAAREALKKAEPKQVADGGIDWSAVQKKGAK